MTACLQIIIQTDIIWMVVLVIDNIYVEFCGRVHQQTVGIPMGANVCPSGLRFVLYSYEVDFV